MSQTRDDRILRATRWVAALVLPVLLSAGVILYIWPDRTAELFAWTIRPSMTPLLMGSGYFMGCYFFIRTLFGARWHTVGTGFLAVAVFAWFMALATLLHWDRFNHQHTWFTIWVVVYAVTPILVPAVWWRNRVTDPGTPEPDDVILPRAVRMIFIVSGLSQLLIGVVMFLAPQLAISIWPWQLTPLTARVVGGWFSLPGMFGVAALLDNRWSGLRILFQAGICWSVLLLAGIARAWADFDKANPLTWVYLAMVGLTLVGATAVYMVFEGRRRAAAKMPATAGPVQP